MKKWILRAVILAVLGYAGYAAYDYYQADFHTRPEMPQGAFSISYKSGLRAILVDVPNEQATRRYFGIPQTVPYYIEKAWATCKPPVGDEIKEAKLFIETRNMPGERFEAVCKIQVDDDVVLRGLITSVPKL